MEHIYTFDDKAYGHLHIMRDMPCEDASISFSEENHKYHIIAIADGHGAKSCFRSNIGSKAAVDVAIKRLKEFAENKLVSTDIEERFYIDMSDSSRYQQMTLKELTDGIITEWIDLVKADYINNPPTSEEMGEYIDEYKDGENIAHIYGSTLIAALWMPFCLILLQQGDGRCDVFYNDGTADQPIPWDARCENNTTTSMCDCDAAESFRTKYIDFSERKVMACYMGSDGIEDAYRDTYEELGGSHVLMGGVHTFYKDLTCQIALKSKEEFEDFLHKMLPEFSATGRFSRTGSGDDISVAGIVDTSVIQQYVEQFQIDVQLYDLEERLFWKEDELRGKTRKHGILLKRWQEVEEKVKQAQKEQEELTDELAILEPKLMQSKEKLIQLEEDLEEYQSDAEDIIEYIEGEKNIKSRDGRRFLNKLLKIASKTIETLYNEIDITSILKEEKCEKLAKRVKTMEKTFYELREKKQKGIEDLSFLESNLKAARETFEQYDLKYQEIANDIKSIQSEMEMLPIVKNVN